VAAPASIYPANQSELRAGIGKAGSPTSSLRPDSLVSDAARPQAADAQVDPTRSIFVPVGYDDRFYLYATRLFPLLFDTQYVYAPSKFGALAAGISEADFLTLALADDPAIVPVAFNRWIEGEAYRNELASRIRKEHGEQEALKVMYFPDFDDQLAGVYQDASFGFLANNVSSREDQQRLVDDLITEKFCRAVAKVASSVAVPSELERKRPKTGTSVDNTEAWRDFAREFLTMYLGDVGIALKFGAWNSQTPPQCRALYELVAAHLHEQDFDANATYGVESIHVSDGAVNEWERFNPSEFMEKVVSLPKSSSWIKDIVEIRKRGHRRAFREWVKRFFHRPQFRAAGFPPEAIVDAMKQELQAHSAAALTVVETCVRCRGGLEGTFAATAALLAGFEDSAMEIVRTSVLHGSQLNEDVLRQLRPKLKYYLPAGTDFMLTYPIRRL
jgi:hypothetical protein